MIGFEYKALKRNDLHIFIFRKLRRAFLTFDVFLRFVLLPFRRKMSAESQSTSSTRTCIITLSLVRSLKEEVTEYTTNSLKLHTHIYIYMETINSSLI